MDAGIRNRNTQGHLEQVLTCRKTPRVKSGAGRLQHPLGQDDISSTKPARKSTAKPGRENEVRLPLGQHRLELPPGPGSADPCQAKLNPGAFKHSREVAALHRQGFCICKLDLKA